MKKISIVLVVAMATLFCHAGNPTTHGTFGYTQNKGQVIDQNNNLNPAVKYLFNQGRLNVQLRTNGFSYDSYTIERKPMPKTGSENAPHNDPGHPIEDITYHYHRIDIEFIGANAAPQMLAQQPSKEYTNYYTTSTPEEGVLNVRTYQKVTYINLYDGIDLEFAISNNLPKYNFIIHPNADASQIKWKYSGAFKITLQDGKIMLSVEQGDLEENIPSSFINETAQNIKVSYVSFSDNTYGFSIPTYDKHTTLTIDPIPWATYFGGSGDDFLNKITRDTTGNLIVTGYTGSSTNIATSGAFQTTYGGGTMDVVLAKFNPSGSLLWSTYYGSTLIEEGLGLITDRNGNILVSGRTSSTSGIATTGAYQTTYGGGAMDAIVLKFTSSGTRTWATYFGGSGDDYGYGITSDSANNILFTGYTTSTSGIATSGTYQTTNAGSNDVFLVKINSSGTSRVWGTFYGGTHDDFASDMTTDSIGNILLTGNTISPTGISTTGTFQTAMVDTNSTDAFLTKFSTSGALIWGTYYGGLQPDVSASVVVSGSNIFIGGRTASYSYIASSGSFQSTYGSNWDAYFAKFNFTGTTRQWGTYFGGNSYDNIFSMYADRNGNIYIIGNTTSPNAIATSGAYQTTYTGTTDGFVGKFNSSGSRVWSTYFGGNSYDGGKSGVVDTIGNVFITGYTSSTTGIATSGAYQTSSGGGTGPYDGFIAAFTSSGGLPVQLTVFEAKLVNSKDVLCTWQTASELNNDYFTIERSVDGSQFTSVGKVKGNGTTNVVSNYQFTDNSLSIVNSEPLTIYYRLKQVDLDGKSTLSEVRVVNLNQLTTNWNIYPNPTTNELHIETSTNEKLGVQLFDVTGKKVMENILFNSSTNINTSSLFEGMYFVRITNADGAVVKTQKVAVVR